MVRKIKESRLNKQERKLNNAIQVINDNSKCSEIECKNCLFKTMYKGMSCGYGYMLGKLGKYELDRTEKDIFIRNLKEKYSNKGV